MTSTPRISCFVVISLVLHLACLTIDFRFLAPALYQQDVFYGYISVSRREFLPEKKTIHVSPPPKKRVVFQKKSAVIESETLMNIVPLKHVAPVTETSPIVAHEEILPWKTPSNSTRVEESTERHIDVAPLPEIAVVDEVSSTVDLREIHKRDPAAESTKISSLPENIVALSNPSSAGGEKGFQSALPRYDLNPKPTYPEVARRRGWEGTVLFEVEVLKDGNVGDLKMVQSSGYRSLDRAAKKAIRCWVFKAARSFGRTVDSRVIVPVDFVLNQY